MQCICVACRNPRLAVFGRDGVVFFTPSARPKHALDTPLTPAQPVPFAHTPLQASGTFFLAWFRGVCVLPGPPTLALFRLGFRIDPPARHPAFSAFKEPQPLAQPPQTAHRHSCSSSSSSTMGVFGSGAKKKKAEAAELQQQAQAAAKQKPSPLRERKGNNKHTTAKEPQTPSSNLQPAHSPTEVDWSSFPEGSYTRFGHGGDWWTLIKGTIAILFTWGTWLAGGTSPFWMAWLYMHGHRTAFWSLLGPLLYPLVLPVPAWPGFVRFILNMAGYFPVRSWKGLRQREGGRKGGI